jgi:aldose 1-epimerase
MMYLNLIKERFSSLFHAVWRKDFLRSGKVTGLLLVLLVLGLALAYRERGRGNIRRLKAEIHKNDLPPDAPPARPGGEDAIVLTRSPLMGGTMPEFLSATLLPGRGMNLFQIKAAIPGLGEVDLMASPSVADASLAMNGSDQDTYGQASLTVGGAFEAPWAGRLGGFSSLAGSHITSIWHGHTIDVPVTPAGATGVAAMGGRILAMAADSNESAPMPDGGQTQAIFHAKDFGASWPSATDVTVQASLSSHTIDLTIVARNTGSTAEPIGIGWHPRFAVPHGGRVQTVLRLPGEMREEISQGAGKLPTGKLLPVAGTPYDFTARDGVRLGDTSLSDTFVHLHQDPLDNGPAAELRDPANNYGLRLTMLGTTIKAVHVDAPADAPYISIAPRFNYDDPFGREWAKDADTGMVILEPGQSTEWRVRLELFQLSNRQPPAQ